jgi:hypothetical protein
MRPAHDNLAISIFLGIVLLPRVTFYTATVGPGGEQGHWDADHGQAVFQDNHGLPVAIFQEMSCASPFFRKLKHVKEVVQLTQIFIVPGGGELVGVYFDLKRLRAAPQKELNSGGLIIRVRFQIQF